MSHHSLNLHNMPLAVKGLTSYRIRSPYGWIMIGAKNDVEALREAARSTAMAPDVALTLEQWNGTAYVPVGQPCAAP